MKPLTSLFNPIANHEQTILAYLNDT